MKIIKQIAILLAVVLILNSCSSSNSATKSTSSTATSVGLKGLEMTFQQNNPPARVFQNTQFPVVLKIANFGNEDTSNAYLSLAYEKDYIRSLKLSYSSNAVQEADGRVKFSVNGKSQINPFGDINLMEFIATSGLLEQQSEEKSTSIAATMCYPYKTVLSTTFCIDPDISGMSKDKKACRVSIMDFKGGQGAPIAVTRIEPIMLADIDTNTIVPQFLIFFENLGKGIPVHPNKVETACKAKLEQRDDSLFNIATVKVYSSGNEELNCKPDDRIPDVSSEDATIRFRDKKDYIRCIFRQNNDAQKVPRSASAYTSPLRVEITYGYMDTVTTQFSIYKPLSH